MLPKDKNKSHKLDKYIRAASECADIVASKGIMDPDKTPDSFFLYVIGVMRSLVAESIAVRFPEYSHLPEIFRIGDSSDMCVPDMLLDELKHLISLEGEKKLKNDPDLICLLICYLAYYNSIADNPECLKLQKKLFMRIELTRMVFSDHGQVMYSSALWFADKHNFRQLFSDYRRSMVTPPGA
ncbi:MAG: hypothetical protein IJM55_10660 [Ruminococcus sp.]|nr:hypothetical protein [Ruminococcus sp.]